MHLCAFLSAGRASILLQNIRDMIRMAIVFSLMVIFLHAVMAHEPWRVATAACSDRSLTQWQALIGR
jgi:hypothetical protein